MIYDLDYLVEISRNKLAESKSEIILLQREKPFLFEDPIIFKALEALESEYHKANRKMADQTFPIATLGTTSAGKSTLINALIGRRIAPIDASEMSGGILRIKHDTYISLTIEKTQGMLWEYGTWDHLEDHIIYERIKGVMLTYHKSRKKGFIVAPQITVRGPLLASNNKKLLCLPDSVQVEFIDLPGLKSVDDKENQEVIQSQVSKALSLVTLDYHQTDEDNRAKLLKELEQAVEYWGGRIDSMIFVLNRVDARGYDDQLLEKRIQLLKQEIRTILGLNEDPEILPLCARLLYYAQCTWGPTSLESFPTAPKDIQKKLVKALFRDCASFLENYYENNSYFEDWCFKLKKYIRNAELDLEAEDLKHLLKGSLQWSGGAVLWKKLQQKIHHSFMQLALSPILQEVTDAHRALNNQLRKEFPKIRLEISPK